MNKIILLISLILSNIAYATDTSDIAVGGIYGTSRGVTLGDYALFDPSKTVFGYYRYGGGTPRLQLGNGLGISVTSINGAIIYKKGIFVLGIEPVSGGFIFNTNNKNIENYYQWSPAVTVGPMINFSSVRFLLLARGGGAIGNHSYDGISPSFRSARGFSFYINSSIESASLNYTLSGDGTYISNIDLQNHYFDIRLEKDKGVREETSAEILFKIY